jgi:hypothetical protein
MSYWVEEAVLVRPASTIASFLLDSIIAPTPSPKQYVLLFVDTFCSFAQF